MSAKIIRLADRRPPIRYTLHIEHYWDGKLTVVVEDAAQDERSRKAIALALREAAVAVEYGPPPDAA